MTCGDQLGAIQTQGTCWFYSILNGFIHSEAGQKILYSKLQQIFKGLGPKEKEYFSDQTNAPCPMKNLTKTKQIYFWKFIDKFLCFQSGPRAGSLKTGRSVELLRNVSLAGTLARQHGGAQGAHPQNEIAKILQHMGFKKDKDFYDGNYITGGKIAFDRRSKPQFIVCHAHAAYLNPDIPETLMKDPDYELMCSSIIIMNTTAKSTVLHIGHAVAGYVCNGKGYIYDSNQTKVFPCDYWNTKELNTVLDKQVARYYPHFRDGKINFKAFAFHIFARKNFINNIAPACLMKYPTKTPFISGINFSDPNLGRRLNDPTQFLGIAPAGRIALKRKWARTNHRPVVYLNKNVYNSIVNSATNFASGNAKLRNFLSAGYRVKDPKDYDEFLQKLRNKFKPKTYTLTEAKKHLNQFSTSGKGVRQAKYSEVWRGLPMAQRKVLMHWRNTGTWLANPSVSPRKNLSVLNAAKRNVNALKTAKARKEYRLKRATNMTKNDLKELIKYITLKNVNARKKRAAKRAAKA